MIKIKIFNNVSKENKKGIFFVYFLIIPAIMALIILKLMVGHEQIFFTLFTFNHMC